ncbi:MAG: methyltransferase domain-containing protein [Nitrospinae bacterium]|nr:methyltransferase domain-containing protein [Nitrospinota bacterium]
MSELIAKIARRLDRMIWRYIAPALPSRQIRSYLEPPGMKGLNLGCGRNLLPEWLNCDSLPIPGAVHLDASRPLPFPANVFDYVFAEHMIEHLPLPSIASLLKDCHRVLKPGGTIRLVTPNLDSFIDMVQRPDSEESLRYTEWSRKRLSDNLPADPVRAMNAIFYGHGHQFVMNGPYLSRLLSDAGFCGIRTSQVGESGTLALRGIEKHGEVIGEDINRIESLAMEADKP